MSRYSNAHHDYAFPRIVGILGDGKTKYNYGDDGDKQAIGACSVSPFVSKHLLTTTMTQTFLKRLTSDAPT